VLNQENLNKLITHAIAIEEAEAIKVGALGYMARILVQATIPHSNLAETTFERTNGKLSLAIMGHPKVGLPYGTYPRLLLAWLATEAVRTKESTIVLGKNLSGFMAELGLVPTGGRWGNIWRLMDQMRRLFSASISCVYSEESLSGGLGFNIAKEYHLWWDPKIPEQADLWQSTVILSQDFFREIIDRPVPIDMRALKALKTSSMALDLYCWLTYRFSYLSRKTEIPWRLLQNQFGSSYANTKQGRFEFKRQLLAQLKKVAVVYEGAIKATVGEYGLILTPSNSHIKKIIK
jgi:hypothetical protein